VSGPVRSDIAGSSPPSGAPGADAGRRAWTYLGLAIALFGIPIVTLGFRLAAGILLALFAGAASTAIYAWKRDVTILIAAHFVIDFIPNVLLPLLSGS